MKMNKTLFGKGPPSSYHSASVSPQMDTDDDTKLKLNTDQRTSTNFIKRFLRKVGVIPSRQTHPGLKHTAESISLLVRKMEKKLVKEAKARWRAEEKKLEKKQRNKRKPIRIDEGFARRNIRHMKAFIGKIKGRINDFYDDRPLQFGPLSIEEILVSIYLVHAAAIHYNEEAYEPYTWAETRWRLYQFSKIYGEELCNRIFPLPCVDITESKFYELYIVESERVRIACETNRLPSFSEAAQLLAQRPPPPSDKVMLAKAEELPSSLDNNNDDELLKENDGEPLKENEDEPLKGNNDHQLVSEQDERKPSSIIDVPIAVGTTRLDDQEVIITEESPTNLEEPKVSIIGIFDSLSPPSSSFGLEESKNEQVVVVTTPQSSKLPKYGPVALEKYIEILHKQELEVHPKEKNYIPSYSLIRWCYLYEEIYGPVPRPKNIKTKTLKMTRDESLKSANLQNNDGAGAYDGGAGDDHEPSSSSSSIQRNALPIRKSTVKKQSSNDKILNSHPSDHGDNPKSTFETGAVIIPSI